MLEGTVDSATGVSVFRGVPYAAPPVGALRWRPPQPAAPWTGVRRADHLGKNCMQTRLFDDIDAFAAGVSEDCLYLNVWTAGKAGDHRPVMVWIHGGAFLVGFGGEDRHDGGRLAKKGVVVVTINYRLGSFGFHGTGNYGILDQIAALEWVKRNIAAFGGDPTRVTVFGESAGAMSIGILIASPLAKGLFERAILESGTGIAMPASMGPVVAPPVLPHPVDSTLVSGGGNIVPIIVGNNADEDSAVFAAPARRFAELMTARGARVYRYVFARRGDPRGAYHSAEITFVFDRPRASGHTDYDSTLAETMSDYWVAFATNGDPNGRGPQWPVYNPERDNYLELGPVVTVRPRP